MSFDSNYYSKYGKNIISQNGEDGVIEQLFSDLNITDGIVVEFGAWDGVYLSNIFNLWKNKGFKALLIEGDSNRANQLLNSLKDYDNTEAMNCFVDPKSTGEYCLDNLLKLSEFGITNDNLSLISMDTDGLDYEIFESLTEYRPKVVIIETLTLQDGEDMYEDRHKKGIKGNTGYIINNLKSTWNLAEKKGYKVVCHTGNAFLVRDDLVDLLPDADFSFKSVHCYESDNAIWQSLNEKGEKTENINYQTKNYKNLLNEVLK